MSLRFRINLAITLAVVIFGIVTAYILVENMRNSINEEIEAGTRVTVQLLETVVLGARMSGPAGDPDENLAAFLQHVGRVRANEIRLYDAEDKLVYESPPSVYKQGRWAPA